MATLTIKDLTASKELDGKAMGAVAGGTGAPSPFSLAALLNITSVSTALPVYNAAENVGYQSNHVGPFNFGVVEQTNTQDQYANQLGNLLGGGAAPH
jgi:hypothetical protein